MNLNRLKLVDKLSGKNVWDFYQEYIKTQWYSEEDIERLRVKKLRKLFEHCYNNVEFYKNTINKKNIEIDKIVSIDVLKEFPIIDKYVVKSNYSLFIPKNLHELKNVKASQTGGTTGEPLRFYKDANTRSSILGAFYRFYDWMGIDYGDATILNWGATIVDKKYKNKLKNMFLDIIGNTKRIDSFKVNEKKFLYLKRMFEKHKPKLLRGYCQSIYELARIFNANNYRYRLKAISTTVEPLFDEYRELFRRVFECETFDQYGCGEVESIAFECEMHNGLHVAEERCIVEVNEDNEIILTDLDNFAFPFIRYKNGDKVILSDNKCKCGRSGRIIKKVLGRTGNVIIGVNGNKVHPEFFTHLLNETDISFKRGLLKYQVIQKNKGEIIWKIVSDDLLPEEKKLLKNYLIKYLGKMKIDIVNVQEIPNTLSGKFRYVISQIERNDKI